MLKFDVLIVLVSLLMGSPVVQARGIEKSFGDGGGKSKVLRGVDLEVNEGERVAIIGQSGSGKSTLLNIVGALDEPDKGDVSVLGVTYSSSSDEEIATLRNQKLGFVFQAFHLLEHLNCLQNVMLPSIFQENTSGAQKLAQNCLARVGLSSFEERKPAELSGGQRQRVAIARALFGQPKLLLCDEPTGNLDSETGEEIIEFFTELNEKDGMTMLLVTHEERISNFASRVVRLSDGKVQDHERERS